ncbi:MAG: Yip1 family protein [Caulobacterales bacterium]
MDTDVIKSSAPSLVERAKNILVSPKPEWERIAGETVDIGKLYTGYVAPLAIVAAVAAFIGMSVFGVSGFGFSYRVPIVAGAVSAVLQVVMGVAGVFLLGLITNALAPTFGSQQNSAQAHKLAAYASTAGFLAGVFTLFPPLAVLGILGLYSLVLVYLGLPRLMQTPQDKRVGYLVAIVVVAIVAGVVTGAVIAAVRTTIGGIAAPGLAAIGQGATPTQPVTGKVTLPGGGEVDLDALQRQAEQAQSMGTAAAVDPAQLQAQLPQSLPGGLALVSTSNGAAMGVAQAEGIYQNGDASLTLRVMHMGAMGAVAGMAAGMNVQENRQDANGYSKTQTIGGRVHTEEVSKGAGTVSYGIVGRGVAVTAEGSNGVTIDQAKAAVGVIGIEALEKKFGGG